MGQAVSKLFDLERQFTFYASYHDNPTNQAIHIACVWPILWTSFVFGAYTPNFVATPALLAGLPHVGKYIQLNLSSIAAGVYATYYALLDKKAGPAAGGLVLAGYLFANYLKQTVPNAWKYALGVHVGCWIAQFVGHGVYEGRKPALLDNIAQSFLMAPFFVFLEVLFKLGYRPDFQRRVEVQVKAAIAEHKKNEKRKL